MKLQPDRMRKVAKKPWRRGDRNKETILMALLARFGREAVVQEHRFHPTRRWRFDYAVPSRMLAVEYEGHGATGGGKHVGGHASVTGMAGDAEKYNQAQALGWKVVRLTALHFTLKDRLKHKLTAPVEMMEMMDLGHAADD